MSWECTTRVWVVAHACLRQEVSGRLLKMRRFDEAESMLLTSLAAYTDAGDPQDREATLQRLVQLYESWNKPEKAAEFRARLLRSP